MLLAGLALLSSCSQKQPDTAELKEIFGEFGQATIKTIPVDVTKTPVYKSILKHPEKYGYLGKVDIFSMAHRSDGNFVTGFVVTPKTPGKYPCIVLNRGGSKESGRLVVATAVEFMAPVAAAGYVVVATNYRGNGGSEGMEEFGGADVRDVLNLMKSMAELEMADTSRIGLLGISRGGMMNYITLRVSGSPSIKGVVSIGAVTDLELTMESHPPVEAVAEELIPGFAANRRTAVIERSANYWADSLPKDVPLLIMHSKTDDHVDYRQAANFADSLEKYQVPFQLLSFENDTHGLTGHREMVLEKALDWFDHYVKQGQKYNEKEIRQDIP